MICIDFEASGLGPLSYPIEVAWKNAASGEQDSFLINPASVSGWDYWDEHAEELHGIDRQELAEQGICVSVAAQRLNTMLDGYEVICDALEFDYFWLSRLFDAARMKPSFKLQGLDAVMTPEQLIQFRFLSRGQLRRHRALRDVEDLIRTIHAVRSEAAG
ncbi:3'-5' exonuclease [Marinobacterium arenosum]|uniref:3'-5' exonuclease n=1 Tax=Marinobacterium arenosum TaxID=2862496 RepID=UPI001C967C54|nr:hypothetical protein [Marinobacterium arenosum]MBY4679036.1 hypothetical protein [Marinobacterium arenosum]